MKAKINLTNCPLLQNKYYHSDSVFTVDSLLENARQQKKILHKRLYQKRVSWIRTAIYWIT